MIEKTLIKLIAYWHKKLHINEFIICKKFHIKKWEGFIQYNSTTNQYMFNYNLKLLKNKKKKEIIMFILHELGHIYYDTYKLHNKIKGKIESEYLAEKFAIENAQKYCHYKNLLRFKEELKDKKWCKKYPNHAFAFKKLYKKLGGIK